MERYIAIKESFFEKWNGEPMRLYVMSQLIRFVSYKDTEYSKKGCLIYNEVQLAKKLNIGRMSLRRVVEYLNKKGEIEIRGCGKGRILEVLYYNTYVVSSEEKEKKEVYQNETATVPKRDSNCTKKRQQLYQNGTVIQYYNNTNNNNNNNSENFVVADVVEKKDSETSTEDNKNEITLIENRENMEEYWKQFGNANNPTWETFSGTLPCGRQVYNLSGEYVCYMKTYVEKGYEETYKMFIRSFTKTGRALEFCQRHNISKQIVIEWLLDFKSAEMDKRQHEQALKKDYKGLGENFYNEINNHLINYLRKKIADREQAMR